MDFPRLMPPLGCSLLDTMLLAPPVLDETVLWLSNMRAALVGGPGNGARFAVATLLATTLGTVEVVVVVLLTAVVVVVTKPGLALGSTVTALAALAD
jgi:hypothetical protein